MKIPAFRIGSNGDLEETTISPDELAEILPNASGFWQDARRALLGKYDYFDQSLIKIMRAIMENHDKKSLDLNFTGVRIYRADEGTPPPYPINDETLAAAGWEYIGDSLDVIPSGKSELAIINDLPRSDPLSPDMCIIDEGAFEADHQQVKDWRESASIQAAPVSPIAQQYMDFVHSFSIDLSKHLEQVRLAMNCIAEAMITEYRAQLEKLRDQGDEKGIYQSLINYVDWIIDPPADEPPPAPDRDPRAKRWESPKFQPKKRR